MQNTAATDYTRVLVKNLPRQKEDEFSAFCFEYGAAGVEEKLKYQQPDIVYDPTIVQTPQFDANVYFTADAAPQEFVERLRQDYPETEASVLTEENRDWMEEWKKGFSAFPFVEPFWIVPSWCTPPPQAKQIIKMDPGMAFGTGTHETTQLAAGLLLSLQAHQPATVLDVGTGTAVLALMAERLFPQAQVIGIDNDLEARRVARENLQTNQSQRTQIPETQLGEIAVPHPIVIANIIDGVLLHLKPDLLKALAARGKMILSGILQEREREFLTQFLEGTGLAVERRESKGEWVAFLLGR